MKLYRAEYFRDFGGGGVTFHIATADEVVVNGTVMVQRGGGVFVDERDKWHETRAAALEQAAGIADGMAETLTKQAAEFRRQAAEEAS